MTNNAINGEVELPRNVDEAFERLDREELHKILFVNDIENDGLHTPVINQLYAYLAKERADAQIEILVEPIIAEPDKYLLNLIDRYVSCAATLRINSKQYEDVKEFIKIRNARYARGEGK